MASGSNAIRSIKDGARIEKANAVDLGLRSRQLHGDGDTILCCPQVTRECCRKNCALYEKVTVAQAKIHMNDENEHPS
jgi:hypothetical protein